MSYQRTVAQALLDIHAVKFSPEKPLTFKSGIVSPVYVDNRTIPYYPAQWRQVIAGFAEAISSLGLSFDVIAGVAVGGVPHSAALAYELGKPSVFVRSEAKGYGTDHLVEGGEVNEKKVLLIEDLVTTGGSSLRGVRTLRTEGAILEHALAIVSYGFADAQTAFETTNVQLNTLTTFPVILEVALETGYFTTEQASVISAWFADPFTWGKSRI